MTKPKSKPKSKHKGPVLAAILTALLAGGSLGGYKVVQDKNVDIFESSVHHVVHVVDGDTLDIEGARRIRLLRIDAPERGTCYFEESTAALKALVEGKDIRIEKDVTGADRYDRLLRNLYLPSERPEEDDIFVDQWLVERGFARVESIAPDTRDHDLLARAEASARAGKKGMWSSACKYLAEYQSAASLREQGSEPPSASCIIKGNISEKGYGKQYFLEGCPNYNRIKVDPRKGEAFFCTEAAAQKAGFTRSASCDTTF
jgi:endonuclease YncB( thermonuclease family)